MKMFLQNDSVGELKPYPSGYSVQKYILLSNLGIYFTIQM